MTKNAEDSIPFTGGKFRNKPSSRPRTMLYHRRRSRTLQIRRNYNDNGRDGGWLSRIVDPTSKLIAGGVQKLFSSVFRRRLPVPPPQSPPDGNVWQDDRGDARFVNSVVVLSDGTIMPSENVNHPSNVNDHNVVFALPAKIPKAIKSSNSGKGSSSALGLLNQTVAEEHPVFSTFELHRPTCCTTPQKQFSTAGTSQNDFVIPRPHGRSARYNRDRATKDSGTRHDAFVGESLSSQKELTLTASGMNHEKEEVQGDMFRKGSLVEISSDEDGYKGAWFPATVVEVLEKGKYLIEHLELRTDDDTELMKEEVDALHIRPTPPKTGKTGRYDLYEKVDALQNDVWWVGVIVRVLAHSRYLVYFKESSEKLKFTHDELRPHQDWIDGKWITAS